MPSGDYYEKIDGTTWIARGNLRGPTGPPGLDGGMVFNVKDASYGAVGDGSTDDTAAIQDALDTAGAAEGTVFLPPGTYNVVQIHLPSNTRLIGSGMNKSIIKATTAACPVRNEDYLGGNDNIEVRDLTIDGNSVNTDFNLRFLAESGWPANSNEDILVENVEAKNGLLAGVQFHNCVRSTARGCYVHDNQRDGFQWSNGTDGSAINNRCYDNGDDSIAFVAYDAPFERALAVGNISADFNAVNGGIHHGIVFAGVHNGTATGNICRGGFVGISAQNFNDNASKDIAIVGNTLERPGHEQAGAGSGIGAYGGAAEGGTPDAGLSGVVIANNTIRSPHVYGIGVSSGSGQTVEDVQVIGNVITNDPDESGAVYQMGIQIGGSGAAGDLTQDVLVQGNRIRDMQGNGIYVRSDGANDLKRISVKDNECLNNGQGGAGAAGITLLMNASDAIEDIVVTGNRCTDTQSPQTQSYGMYFHNDEYVRGYFDDNDFRGNLTEEIHNVYAATPTIASAATITLPPLGDLFYISGTTTITSITATYRPKGVTLIFLGALTLTDGSNLKLNGNLVTTADDTITLRCDAFNWYEVGRSVN